MYRAYFCRKKVVFFYHFVHFNKGSYHILSVRSSLYVLKGPTDLMHIKVFCSLDSESLSLRDYLVIIVYDFIIPEHSIQLTDGKIVNTTLRHLVTKVIVFMPVVPRMMTS